MSEPCSAVIEDAGAVPHIAELLRSGLAALKEPAAQALHQLAINKSRQAQPDTGAWQGLIFTLVKLLYAKDTSLATTALRTLCVVALSGQHWGPIRLARHRLTALLGSDEAELRVRLSRARNCHGTQLALSSYYSAFTNAAERAELART